MTWADLVRLGRGLPDVEESAWFGTPSLAVRGKSFCRLKEDGESVVFLLDDVDEQDVLVAAKPSVYFVTDHYRGHPSVLARLSKLTTGEARARLAQAWRKKAPATLVRKFDAGVDGPQRRR